MNGANPLSFPSATSGLTVKQMLRLIEEQAAILNKPTKTKADFTRVKELAHLIAAECSRRI